jgi:hypothetical protein
MESIDWLLAAFCALISAGIASLLRRRYGVEGRLRRILIAGFEPTLLIVVALSIWQVVARMEFDRTHHEDGFMGPLVILIYGFPLILGNLCANLAVPAWFGRSK